MRSRLIAGLMVTLFLVNMLMMVNSVSAVSADINNDGIVDIVDATICSLAMWSQPGDPNWNATADLNVDNLINVIDLVIIGINFGQTV